ncbi:hypothetical protein DERF_000985 [Dermatophagoides farinae]|uniref:Transmembrane protein n=1 Tax=Dermatophagoides farinae TaxID=6954 RepID=A0A922LCR7_DERFA|nr:hypothetical protein DERF_000985 [Dermatophagoides farinae]
MFVVLVGWLVGRSSSLLVGFYPILKYSRYMGDLYITNDSYFVLFNQQQQQYLSTNKFIFNFQTQSLEKREFNHHHHLQFKPFFLKKPPPPPPQPRRRQLPSSSIIIFTASLLLFVDEYV